MEKEKRLINANKIKQLINETYPELCVAHDFFDAINSKIMGVVDTACQRCISNKRKTVMTKDV